MKTLFQSEWWDLWVREAETAIQIKSISSENGWKIGKIGKVSRNKEMFHYNFRLRKLWNTSIHGETFDRLNRQLKDVPWNVKTELNFTLTLISYWNYFLKAKLWNTSWDQKFSTFQKNIVVIWSQLVDLNCHSFKKYMKTLEIMLKLLRLHLWMNFL